jgi:hypothetical protein
MIAGISKRLRLIDMIASTLALMKRTNALFNRNSEPTFQQVKIIYPGR